MVVVGEGRDEKGNIREFYSPPITEVSSNQ